MDAVDGIDEYPDTLEVWLHEVWDNAVGEYEWNMDLVVVDFIASVGQLTLVLLLEGCSVPAAILLNIYFICGI